MSPTLELLRPLIGFICEIYLMESDPFGFKTQGSNYEAFRPRYPQKMLDKCLSKLKGRNKYLDIATGTGQVLFALAPAFKSALGTDISEKMLAVSR